MQNATTIQTTDSVRSNRLWASVDRSLVDKAAAVPVVNDRLVALVSERVLPGTPA
jgi:hypothetical protein